MISIVSSLRIDEKRMLKNMALTQGRLMSESVMIALTKKGVSRQTAHELLRKLTIKSEGEKRPVRDVLLEDKTVSGKLDEKEIAASLNPKNYLGTSVKQVNLAVKETLKERRARRQQ
jgi:adenylosuccinate lyase